MGGRESDNPGGARVYIEAEDDHAEGRTNGDGHVELWLHVSWGRPPGSTAVRFRGPASSFAMDRPFRDATARPRYPDDRSAPPLGWSIWIDESGQFDGKAGVSVVTAVYVQREMFPSFRALRRDLLQANPLSAWPLHACHDVHLARRVVSLLRSPPDAEAPHASPLREALQPAVDFVATAPNAYFRRIRDGGGEYYDWSTAEERLVRRFPGAAAALAESRASTLRVLGEFGRQSEGSAGVVLATADGASSPRTAYPEALRACLRRLRRLRLGDEVSLTVARRSITQIGEFGSAWLRERLVQWGLPRAWAPRTSAVPYDESASAPLVLTDLVANRARAALGGRTATLAAPLTAIEERIADAGALGLPAHLRLRHPPTGLPLLTSVRGEAAIDGSAPDALPDGWERDQATLVLAHGRGGR